MEPPCQAAIRRAMSVRNPEPPSYVTRRWHRSYFECATDWVTSCLFPERVRYRHKPDSSPYGSCRRLYWGVGNVIYSYGSHFPIATFIPFHDNIDQDREVGEGISGAFFINLHCENWLGSKGYSNTTRNHIQEVHRALSAVQRYGGTQLICRYASPRWILDCGSAVSRGRGLQDLIIDRCTSLHGRKDPQAWDNEMPANEVFADFFKEVTRLLDRALEFNSESAFYRTLNGQAQHHILHRIDGTLSRLFLARDWIRGFLVASGMPYQSATLEDPLLFKGENYLVGEAGQHYKEWDTRVETPLFTARGNGVSVAVPTQSEESFAEHLMMGNAQCLKERLRNLIAVTFRQTLISPVSGTTLEAYLKNSVADILVSHGEILQRVHAKQRKVIVSARAKVRRADQKVQREKDKRAHLLKLATAPYGDASSRGLLVPEVSISQKPEEEDVDFVDLDRAFN